MEEVQRIAARIVNNVEQVIVGKRRIVELVLVALLCRGHVLIEDVPGTGKTMLAKSIARSIGSSFKRIQCTPDLLPGDVTGVSIFNQQTREFEFRPGPIMAQIVLADEINRATPKTQSALLEAMEERQITVDGVTHALPQPFIVLATQNPIEYEGTFPLPEAQLDRFLLRVHLGYADRLDEIAILKRQREGHPLETLPTVVDMNDLLHLQEVIKQVHVDDLIVEYIVALTTATRDHGDVYLGASTRGALALYRAAQAWAALNGRDFVTPDDVKVLAQPVLSHRLIVSPAARVRNVTAQTIIDEVLAAVPVPGARAGRRFERMAAG
ncbi:MAG TPA: MoxR family ATPase [Chloroflexus aurantiacus]|uniref:ATPase associated with various cellular activities AAA_3 n=1 Tax=Chloroflexus aurantiacus (strain ATCC 29366 / DSM 635 / J-10-fl) TaxID=324602 RepID=A9WDB5_CHLAA|nr:MoxR family ATPase [Chloroflexus aurantiacus]ABY35082.1 ATPase associated with various cellular activities AAA_3 [Chloroflexus aurantiacus J-10-fl]RMG53572.1 MAG: MoxR family ATPase [Chloroflexota bacterium]GIV92526.1 MAG: ATPase [Chloroflexus sp.]HBW65998.1 MoxR family ATPase [Chloroflexus aurantiacus]